MVRLKMRALTPSRRYLSFARLTFYFILSVPFLAYAEQQTQPSRTKVSIKGLETIEIRGFRDSAVKSLSEKRHHNGVSEVINAEDIGQFPDKNVAEALQRLTGISLFRAQGEGERIGVRGTTAEQNRTYLNGQYLASSDWWISSLPSRGFNFTLLPSEIVHSVSVLKTPQAKHDEGSLGGAINITTPSPLDNYAPRTVLAAQLQYNDLSRAFDPQFTLHSEWQNSAHTLGVIVSYTHNQRSVRRDGLESWGWDDRHFSQQGTRLYPLLEEQNPAQSIQLWSPGGGGSAVFQQQRELNTLMIAAQYVPNPRWRFALTSLYSHLDADNTNQNFLWQPSNVYARGGHLSDYHVIDSVLAYGAYTQVPTDTPSLQPFNTAMEAIWRDSAIATTSNTLTATWQRGLWQAQYQLGMSRGSGGTREDHTTQFSANTAFRVDTRQRQNIIAEYEVAATDAQQWLLSDIRNDAQDAEDEQWYTQIDITRAVDHSVINRIELGIKARDHQRSFTRRRSIGGDYTGLAGDLGWRLSQFSAPFPEHYLRHIGSSDTLKRYAYADTQALARLYRSIDFHQYEERPSRFEINERSLAGYTQIQVGADTWQGNLGVRLVATEQQAEAYAGPAHSGRTHSGRTHSVANASTGQLGQWQQSRRRYWDFLPSLTLSSHLSDNLLLRLGAARVMSRPQYHHLMPSTNYNVTQAQGQGGYPQLDPYRANQFDAALEWYFNDIGLLSGTVFMKDIASFIEFERRQEEHEGILMTIDRPTNGAGGTITGAELALQHEFWYGFGVLANYTYVQGSREAHSAGTLNAIPGTSKHSVNFSVYYQQPLFDVRLAYNYRTRYATGVGETFMDNYGQLDASVRVNLTEQLQLNLDVINLNNEITYLYERSHLAPTGIYENGRRFYTGLRYTF
ncbi:TonB-dependent receptor [Pseudoalteromonas ruthenica]|nr:TonB-dependent receptor [Pseudoalteromonas ruthenica]TMP23608.1 TonB-dependent receptor [Pseudoalteromonas ruthenica]